MTVTYSTVPSVLVDLKHKQKTKLAAGQFSLYHLLIIFNENCYFNIYYNIRVTEATLHGF